jgi:hypothetical protein
MSDFCTTLYVNNGGGLKFNSKELEELSGHLKTLIEKSSTYRSYDNEPFDHTFVETPHDYAYCTLCEYYYSGDEEEDKDLFHTVKEDAQEVTAKLISDLSARFPEYMFSAKTEDT